MHDLESRVPQSRIPAQLIGRLEAVVVSQFPVRFGDGKELLPLEVHPRDHLTASAQ